MCINQQGFEFLADVYILNLAIIIIMLIAFLIVTHACNHVNLDATRALLATFKYRCT